MKKLKKEEIDAAIACNAEYGTLIKTLDEALYDANQRLKVIEKALHNAVKAIQCATCPYKNIIEFTTNAVNDSLSEFLEKGCD